MAESSELLAEKLRRIREFGRILKDNPSSIEEGDSEFFGNALINIGKGENPDGELDIRVGRGQISAKKAYENDQNYRLFCGWLHAATKDIPDGGKGMTIENAVAEAADTRAFGLTEETLRTYVQRYRKHIKEDFKL